MIRGLYTSTFGMMVNEAHHNVIANNIANVDTPAFKMDRLAVSMEPEMQIHRVDDHKLDRIRLGIDPAPYIGNMGTGVAVSERYTVQEQGQIIPTNNPLDVALDGKGFFMADTPDGIRFLRAGNFRLNNEGIIVDSNGNSLLGMTSSTSINPNTSVVMEGGTVGIQTVDIKFDEDTTEINIGNDGTVYQGTDPRYRLVVVEFPNPERLYKTENNYYNYAGPNLGTFAFNTDIKQGHLEKSNVKAVEEMVKMIAMYRSYESNQKIIQTQDETLNKAVNNIARIG
jgi:flagellar basal-body rod protein FlgG